MYRVENLMNVFFNIAMCTAPHVIPNISNVEYHVKIRKIDEENFRGNANGVYVYLEDLQEKKYFEIETKFLQINGDNTKTDVTLETAVFDIQKVNGVSHFTIFTIDSEDKKLKYVKDIRPAFFNNNVLKAKSGTVCDTYLENNKIKILDSTETTPTNNDTICPRFFMFEAINLEDVEIKDNIEFSIPISEFVTRSGKLMISRLDGEDLILLGNANESSEQSNQRPQTDVSQENNFSEILIDHEEDYLNEEIVIVQNEAIRENLRVKNENKLEKQSECKEDAKNENETEKKSVETNDSLKLVTKIVYGVVIPLICVCILITVFVVMKRRKTNTKENYYTTINSEFGYYQV